MAGLFQWGIDMSNAINGDWPASKADVSAWQISYETDCDPFRHWWQVGPAQVPIGADYEQAEKDARLIAAAPQLLAACKRALTLDSVSPDCEEIHNELTAAIRAAEGVE